MKSLLTQIEVQDAEIENVLKEKYKVTNEAKANKKKKNKGITENGSAAEPLPSRLKSKFEKLVEACDSKIADLEYTIDTKESDLQAQAKEMDGLFTHISELNEKVNELSAQEKSPKPKEESAGKPKEEPAPKPKEGKAKKPKGPKTPKAKAAPPLEE